jgi:hypothetical protein
MLSFIFTVFMLTPNDWYKRGWGFLQTSFPETPKLKLHFTIQERKCPNLDYTRVNG